MEPFGLLRFLQAMLGGASNPSPSEDQEAASTLDCEPYEQPQPPPDNQTSTTPSTGPRQDAILRFMLSHEQRANRTKK